MKKSMLSASKLCLILNEVNRNSKRALKCIPSNRELMQPDWL